MLTYEHEERRTVDAPAEEVFAMLTDLPNHPGLAGSGELHTIRVLSEGPVRVGTRWEADEQVRVGKKQQAFVAQSEMVGFDPPFRMAWTSTPPGHPKPKRIEWTYQLHPHGGTTEVVERVEVDFGMLNGLMRLPYKRMRGDYVAEGMRRTLDNIAIRAAH